jgi:hypothetical protein
MDFDKEIELIELTKRLDTINKKIENQINALGKEDEELRHKFFDLIYAIKKILSDSDPIDKIIDGKTREMLRRIRDDNYFVYDEYMKSFMAAVKRLEKKGLIVDFFRSLGIEVTEVEVDQELERRKNEFDYDINYKLDSDKYLNRKSLFGAIITDKRLPPIFHSYYSEIKDCFLFGQMKATIGLCRVIIEVAFRDRYRHLGLAHRYKKQNVYSMDHYRIKNIMRVVCDEIKIKSLLEETCKVYDMGSRILHGEIHDIGEDEESVANLIRDTFIVIEKLYK